MKNAVFTTSNVTCSLCPTATVVPEIKSVSLSNFDTIEIVDSWTAKELDEIISMLQEARNHISNVDPKQGEFNYEQ